MVVFLGDFIEFRAFNVTRVVLERFVRRFVRKLVQKFGFQRKCASVVGLEFEFDWSISCEIVRMIFCW